MKRLVTVTFEVDSEEYEGVESTPEGLLDLVTEMLRDQADLPDVVTISMDGLTPTTVTL